MADRPEIKPLWRASWKLESDPKWAVGLGLGIELLAGAALMIWPDEKWIGVLVGLIGLGVIVYSICGAVRWRHGPNMSAREAYRHLMIDSKWAIGKKVDPFEQSGSSNSSGGRLYRAINDELYDGLNKGSLKVWSDSKEIPEGRWKKDLRFDLTSIMGYYGSPKVEDFRTDPPTLYDDVMVDKKQFLKLWPKATFFQRWKDKKFRGYREIFYDREYQNGEWYGGTRLVRL